MEKMLVDRMRTSNDLVNGELWKFPVYINAQIGSVRVWLKLTRMNGERLPFNAYRMLCNLDDRGKTNWLSKIRHFFKFVWI